MQILITKKKHFYPIIEMDSENFQKKLYFVNEQLKDLHSKLSSYEIQSRIPLENLSMMGE